MCTGNLPALWSPLVLNLRYWSWSPARLWPPECGRHAQRLVIDVHGRTRLNTTRRFHMLRLRCRNVPCPVRSCFRVHRSGLRIQCRHAPRNLELGWRHKPSVAASWRGISWRCLHVVLWRGRQHGLWELPWRENWRTARCSARHRIWWWWEDVVLNARERHSAGLRGDTSLRCVRHTIVA